MTFYARLRRIMLWAMASVGGISLIGLSPSVALFAIEHGPFELLFVAVAFFAGGAWLAATAVVEMVILLHTQFKDAQTVRQAESR